MSWTLEIDNDLRIIIITYRGKNTGKDFLEVAAARIELVKLTGISTILVEVSKLKVDTSSIIDVYEIANNMYGKLIEREKIKIAITTPEDQNSIEMVDFYETACIHRGVNVKKFANRKNAIDWLLKS